MVLSIVTTGLNIPASTRMSPPSESPIQATVRGIIQAETVDDGLAVLFPMKLTAHQIGADGLCHYILRRRGAGRGHLPA